MSKKISKFIGTIIDKSYFDYYKDGENVYQMCFECDKPVLLKDKNGLTGRRKHCCNKDKNYWCYGVQLDRDGFMFIPAKENIE